VWWFVNSGAGQGEPRAAVGSAAPPIVGTTLDGEPFDLSTYRGRPVIVNFWGPSCIPCRDEFPQFLQKLDEHAADDLAIVGVLTDDPPEPARRFVADYGATWPTVIDPGESLKRTYRVAGRPFSWFLDRAGVIRARQIGGPMTDEEFERHFAQIR
jgi:cytochrome c biogenesis protein CcmG/thiol:disulfide interchange protein DsbE